MIRLLYICSGRPILAQRIEYLEKLVAVVVRLFAAGQEMIRKVGALYILYGIYMKLGTAERWVKPCFSKLCCVKRTDVAVAIELLVLP